MKILDELTVKSLLLNKKRSIVTIIGIILSVALIAAISSMIVSFRTSLIDFEKKQNGNFHYSFNKVTKEQLNEFDHNRYIESYDTLENIGYAKLPESKNEYKPYVKVIGIDKKSYANFSIKLIEGTYPQNENEILIPRHLKTNGRVDYKIGDTITLDIGQRILEGYELTQNNPYEPSIKEELISKQTKEYKIVGIIERPSDNIEPYSAPGYTFVTVKDNNQNNNYTVFTRYNKNGLKNHQEVTNNIIKNNNFEVTNNTYLIALETNTFGDSSMKALGFIGAIVILIVIVTSVFCIRNSFNISITEKIKDYGMLSSIGATSKQIKQSVYREALILATIGIPLGILSGVLAAYTLIIIVNRILIKGDAIIEGLLIFKTSPLAILISIILSLVTIFLSSKKGAKMASKTSPINAIRGNNEIKITSKKVRSPKYINKIFGIGGDISYKNIKRNKKKYRTTVISIIVCVAAYVALSYFINTVFRAAKVEYGEYPYNISVYAYQKDYKTNYNNALKISKLDTIKRYSLIRMSLYEINNIKFTPEYIKYEKINPNETSTTIALLSLGKEEYLRYLKSINLSYEDAKDKLIIINNNMTEQEGKTIEYNMLDIKNGATINGKIGETPLTTEVAKLTTQRPLGYENYYGQINAVVSDEFIDKIEKNEQVQLFIDSSNPDELQDKIEKILSVSGTDYTTSNIDHIQKQANSLYTVIAIFLYGFIIVIALIGITNIFNTITTNISLRKREFATLKSIGMTTKEFNRMIFLESFFYCTKSLIIGIPIGIILSYLLYLSLSNQIQLTYVLPYKGIIISIFIVFILIYTLMIYSVNKLKDNNIIETIRNENI